MDAFTFSPGPMPARNTFREAEEAAVERESLGQEWPKLRTIILRTLRSYPEALAALHAALADSLEGPS